MSVILAGLLKGYGDAYHEEKLRKQKKEDIADEREYALETQLKLEKRAEERAIAADERAAERQRQSDERTIAAQKLRDEQLNAYTQQNAQTQFALNYALEVDKRQAEVAAETETARKKREAAEAEAIKFYGVPTIEEAYTEMRTRADQGRAVFIPEGLNFSLTSREKPAAGTESKTRVLANYQTTDGEVKNIYMYEGDNEQEAQQTQIRMLQQAGKDWLNLDAANRTTVQEAIQPFLNSKKFRDSLNRADTAEGEKPTPTNPLISLGLQRYFLDEKGNIKDEEALLQFAGIIVEGMGYDPEMAPQVAGLSRNNKRTTIPQGSSFTMKNVPWAVSEQGTLNPKVVSVAEEIAAATNSVGPDSVINGINVALQIDASERSSAPYGSTVLSDTAGKQLLANTKQNMDDLRVAVNTTPSGDLNPFGQQVVRDIVDDLKPSAGVYHLQQIWPSQSSNKPMVTFDTSTGTEGPFKSADDAVRFIETSFGAPVEKLQTRVATADQLRGMAEFLIATNDSPARANAQATAEALRGVVEYGRELVNFAGDTLGVTGDDLAELQSLIDSGLTPEQLQGASTSGLRKLVSVSYVYSLNRWLQDGGTARDTAAREIDLIRESAGLDGFMSEPTAQRLFRASYDMFTVYGAAVGAALEVPARGSASQMRRTDIIAARAYLSAYDDGLMYRRAAGATVQGAGTPPPESEPSQGSGDNVIMKNGELYMQIPGGLVPVTTKPAKQ